VIARQRFASFAIQLREANCSPFELKSWRGGE
jgi:hypothetical protein